MKQYKVYEIYNNKNEYQGFYLENEKELAEQYSNDINGYIKESTRYFEV